MNCSYIQYSALYQGYWDELDVALGITKLLAFREVSHRSTATEQWGKCSARKMYEVEKAQKQTWPTWFEGKAAREEDITKWCSDFRRLPWWLPNQRTGHMSTCQPPLPSLSNHLLRLFWAPGPWMGEGAVVKNSSQWRKQRMFLS